jgi:membrane fusion protein, heavy metal efflux system
MKNNEVYMKRQNKTKLKTAAMLALAAAVGLTGCKHEKSAEDAPAAKIDGDKITFATNAPQLGYLSVEQAQERHSTAVGLSGRLAWDDDVTVRVFSPVAGRVAKVQAEVNMPVKKGDVLTSLESPDYGQAQSDKQKAASDLALADRTLTRTRELFAHGAAAQKDVESAEADLAKAKSEFERADAQVKALSLGHVNSAPGLYDLCSPLDGIVVEKNISPGQQVRSDQILANAPQFVNPLFVVTDPARLWLFLDVSETDVTLLSSNQEVIVHARAFPDKIFHGHIEVIGEGLDSTTRSIKVRCLMDNSEKQLRAEMYVNADVVSPASGVQVSARALFLRDNDYYVFVEQAVGTYQRTKVKVGVEKDGKVPVLNGVTAGQRVVTDGALLLQSLVEPAG